MYESFFQFREKPFSLIPDVSFVYLGKQHGTALAMLQYGLTNEAAITVITGPVGSGKTTLIRHMVEHVDRDETTIGLINSPHRSFGELLQWVLLAFDLEYRDQDPVERYQNFMDFLNTEYAEGRRTILIVDEAQNLAPDTIEELRMLTNINANKRLALHLILVGQSELRDTLCRPELKQFVQRMSVDYNIEALDEDETRRYIYHRIQVAGGKLSVFDDDCYALIHHYAGGIPRLINSICNTALEYAYASQNRAVTAEMIEEVAQDRARGGFFEMPKIDYFRGLKNIADNAPSISRQNVENLLQLPEQSKEKDSLLGQPEHSEPKEGLLRQPEHSGPMESLLGQPEHSEPKEDLLRQPEHSGPMESLLRQPEHSEPMESLFRQPEQTEPKESLLPLPEHSEPKEGLLRQPEHSGPMESLLRQPEQTEPKEELRPVPKLAEHNEPLLRTPERIEPSLERRAVTEVQAGPTEHELAQQSAPTEQQGLYTGKLLTTEHDSPSEIFLEYDLVIDELLAFFRRRKVT